MNVTLLQSDSLPMGWAIIIGIFYFALLVFVIATMWIIYKKAGYQGWECIIPIYSTIVLLKIVGKPWWWIFLLLLVPFSLIWVIWMTNMLSKSFGKDSGFTAGLLLLGFIFYPILAFGKAEYQGPYGDKAAYDAYQASKQTFDFEKK
jgi:hypothetical protein